MLVVALIVQLALGAALVVVAVNGFPLIGGGGGSRAAPPAAGAPAAPGVPRPRTNAFDERRAFALLRYQVERIGPRPAGSPALARLQAFARARLPAGRYEPVPGHPGLRNVVGRLPGRGPAILVGAHVDTVDTPVGMPGANDGAAGTAVLLELARVLRGEHAGGREVRFVLFDGEEAPGDRDFLRTGLRGSTAYARAHRGQVSALILLDYVGVRGLRLAREGSSDAALWERLRRAARSVGVGAVFPDRVGATIYDDHTPFLRQGVPAIDLIGWPYRYMHTLQDTVDKTSPASLDAVGESVLALVRELRVG
ncbi:MAG: glutaminyl-peptide cyclotransferase [Solirubrobacteraceae bacterium]|nr:glutaminyl-peptide cyclotransferase [Solirubrobacteraceae bacterium]